MQCQVSGCSRRGFDASHCEAVFTFHPPLQLSLIILFPSINYFVFAQQEFTVSTHVNTHNYTRNMSNNPEKDEQKKKLFLKSQS